MNAKQWAILGLGFLGGWLVPPFLSGVMRKRAA